MAFDKQEIIQQLKFEIQMIEKGAYYPSVRDARKVPEIFLDSVTCLNVGLEEKKHPCTSCLLSVFVPPAMRNSSGGICHEIPLNEKGDTIASLKNHDDPYKLQATVLVWLNKTVARLEEEVAAGNGMG